jgi:hypothetical protein
VRVPRSMLRVTAKNGYTRLNMPACVGEPSCCISIWMDCRCYHEPCVLSYCRRARSTKPRNCCARFPASVRVFSLDILSHRMSEFVIFVRRDSAVKLVDGLAGESPASADYPVGTVVISGDGAGDQTVESPDVNVLVGWTQVRSAPTGGQAKQQVVAKANRSQASKTHTSQESECEVRRECRNFYPTLKASVFGEVLGKGSRRVPRGLRGRHVVKEHR